MADVSILNTTAGISGKTVTLNDVDGMITGLHTFNRGSGSAPFAVGSGAALVSNLDADKLDGVEGSAYATLTGAQTLTNKTLTTPAISQIAFPAIQSASANANTLDDYEENTSSTMRSTFFSSTFGRIVTLSTATDETC